MRKAGVGRDGEMAVQSCLPADTWRVCCSAPRRLISMNALPVGPSHHSPTCSLLGGGDAPLAFAHRLHFPTPDKQKADGCFTGDANPYLGRLLLNCG